MTATAYAHTNIALVKYWGKRDDGGRGINLPAVGSLSLTLDRFGTETTVELAPGDAQDTLVLDGVAREGAERERVSGFLERVRAQAGVSTRARVRSRNDVPTAAGLASSASAFCALALAASRAYGLTLDGRQLSILARCGSGSAARSVYGGFVLLHRGTRDDGEDCFAEPLESTQAPRLDARLVVVRCGAGPKEVASTSGMGHSQRTSPFFPAWVETHPADLLEARAAVAAAELARLGEVMEHSTLKMHATTFSARPGFFYWTPTTLAALAAVRALRAQGTGAWATMDAGPHVKVLCAPADAARVAAALAEVPGVHGVDVAAPGPGAHLREAGTPSGGAGA